MFSLVSKLLGLLAVVNGNVVVYTPDTPHLIEDEFRDIPASFGPDLPLEGLRGFLVVGDPEDGCGKLAPPPTADNFTEKWIVLVGRFNCSFEVKVRNAMAAGYGCAIVHNVNSSELETMSAKNPDGINIPSVFVNDVAGRQLADNYVYTKGYYIMVNGDLPFNINTHLLLPFAVVVALCLIVILIFMIVKCIKDRRRARRHRLPNRSLKKIPTCKFSKGDPYETCAICLDDYQEGERLRVLPCAHAYHAKCVDPWLTQNRRVCPVCKRRVLTAGERQPRPARDSDDSDDTDPLLDDNTPSPTQGGTFEQQRENPFQRAARMMARRLRGRDEPDDEERPQVEETDPANDASGEGRSDDTAPLLPAATTRAVSERRARRNERSARSRSHPAPSPSPSPAHSPSLPAPALLRSEGSINTEQHAQIGVAALPAQRESSPHHLQL